MNSSASNLPAGSILLRRSNTSMSRLIRRFGIESAIQTDAISAAYQHAGFVFPAPWPSVTPKSTAKKMKIAHEK
jgi:hypothetical protein